MKIPIIKGLPPVLQSQKDRKPFIHLAINSGRISAWAKDNNVSMLETSKKCYIKIFELLEFQHERKILVLTINLKLTSDEERVEFINFFREAKEKDIFNSTQTRVYVLGKWYDLEQELIDTIREAVTATAGNDRFFLNLCVRYDGHDEIANAFINLGRKLLAEKTELDDIDDAAIKENIYSSNFPPPQLIIETEKTYSGLLLWDSKGSRIFFADKHFLDLKKQEIENAMAAVE